MPTTRQALTNMTDVPFEQSTRNISVLIVEDHALTRIGLRTILKMTADIIVIGEATNGEEAVTQALVLKPNVVLMDVNMPIMDGIHAARIILQNNQNSKVIMLTQLDKEDDIIASLSTGASGYCLKNVAPERLYTAIRSVNAGDTWLDATIAGRVLKHFIPERNVDGEVSDKHSASLGQTITSPKINTDNDDLSDFLKKPLVESLSLRELEVLRSIVDGLSNQEISDKLFISLSTAKSHVRNILNKLAVDDRTQAAVHAMRRGLV